MIPKVSVVIPTYNRAGFLREALGSALSQDYGNIEVVVSDNASSDGTPATMEEYAGDKRVRYFRNERNIGMYPNQRRALFDHASGDWAIMLDDDDYLTDRHYISKAMKIACDDQGVVLVHANCRILEEDSGQFKDTDKRLPKVVDGKWMFIRYKYAVIGNINYDKVTVVFNRRVALELNCFNDTISSGDRDGFLKMSLRGKVGFIDDVVGVYRIHGGNASGSGDVRGVFDNIRAVTGPYEYARDLGLFGQEELEKWKRRMIREWAGIVFAESLLKGRGAVIKEFVRRLYHEYPFALTTLVNLFRPRILGRLILRKMGKSGT